MKKGGSHIEVIFAFVLFLSFVVIIIYFFNPIEKGNSKDGILNYVVSEIKKDLEENLETIYIKSEQEEQCIKYDIKIEGINKDNIVVKNLKEEEVEFDLKEENGRKTIEVSNDGYFVIRVSSGIKKEYGESEEQECILPEGSEKNKKIVSTTENIITERKINELKKRYIENYTKLKNELKIPESIDFLFSVKIDEKEINLNKKIPSRVSVFGKEEKIKILKEDGDIKFGELNVLIW